MLKRVVPVVSLLAAPSAFEEGIAGILGSA